MKKLVYSVFSIAVMITPLFSDSWERHWVKGIEHCDKKEFLEAANEFTSSIDILEASDDQSHFNIYVDRARVYILLDKYINALEDVSKAIESGTIKGKDLPRALVTRFSALSNLGLDCEASKDLETLKTLSVLAEPEFTDEYVIIRNISDCECSRKMIVRFLVDSGICENESDISISDSGFCIAKRKKCDCKCSEENSASEQNARDVGKDIENCRKWCDRLAKAGDAWCGHKYIKYSCIIACIEAVSLIKKGCYWCCKNGNFYRDCIQPFDSIGNYIDTSKCDPFFD